MLSQLQLYTNLNYKYLHLYKCKYLSQMKKTKIPKALREQVWIKIFGKKYENKCYVKWCSNTISVFDFECGHNIPESKGGRTIIENLYPICSRCNKSMNSDYTIDEWNKLSQIDTLEGNQKTSKLSIFSCFTGII